MAARSLIDGKCSAYPSILSSLQLSFITNNLGLFWSKATGPISTNFDLKLPLVVGITIYKQFLLRIG